MSTVTRTVAGAITILVAEDGDDDLFFMKRALKGTTVPHDLRVVIDGQQAVDYLAGENDYADRARWPLPHILFLDLKMPRLNGFEVLEWMRARQTFDHIKVVVLTGSPEVRDRQRAEALGAFTYLVKPPTREMIQNVVTSVRV